MDEARRTIVLWVGAKVMPHEGEVRRWLRRSRVPQADADDLIQEAYCRMAALSSVIEVWWGISRTCSRKSTLTPRSTIGIRKTSPGPLEPIHRPKRKTTRRWYSGMIRMADASKARAMRKTLPYLSPFNPPSPTSFLSFPVIFPQVYLSVLKVTAYCSTQLIITKISLK